ncbi:MAG: hypothetical protein V4535_06920 [Bacteroidota bacterium]
METKKQVKVEKVTPDNEEVLKSGIGLRNGMTRQQAVNLRLSQIEPRTNGKGLRFY